MNMLTFLVRPGLAVIVFVTVSALLCIKHPRDRRYELLFLTAFAFAGLVVAIGFFIAPIVESNSTRLDQYMLRTEGWFGYPSFRLGAFLEQHRTLQRLIAFAYASYTAPLLFLPFLYFNRDALRFMRTMIFNFIPCFPFYMMCPVSGPHYAFPEYPKIPVIPHPVPIHLLAVPNGMPSVHLSTALLVLFFLRPWKIGVIFGWIWVILTVIGTLGLGEHYVLDLVASLPYVALVLFCAGYRFRKATKPLDVEQQTTVLS